MASEPLSIEEIMAILRQTPPQIVDLTRDLDPAQLEASPGPDAWSIRDVLAHLRACHDVLGGNVLRILAEDQPSWKGMSPRAWLKRTDYPTWAFAPAFEAFERQRAELLLVLDPLPAEGWTRTATVTGMLGETYHYSARYYAGWMAGHERAHWKHIGRLARAFDEPAEPRGAAGRDRIVPR